MVLDFAAGADIGGGGGATVAHHWRHLYTPHPKEWLPLVGGLMCAPRNFSFFFFSPFISRHHRTGAFWYDVQRIFPQITEIGDSLVYWTIGRFALTDILKYIRFPHTHGSSDALINRHRLSLRGRNSDTLVEFFYFCMCGLLSFWCWEIISHVRISFFLLIKNKIFFSDWDIFIDWTHMGFFRCAMNIIRESTR